METHRHGGLTLPRVLSVKGGVLREEPVAELEALRGERWRMATVK